MRLKLAIFSALFVSILGQQTCVAQNAGPEVTSAKKLSKQDLQFFESKIRPVLVDRCYSCHSLEANLSEGGFRLDSREALLRGGTGGPAIVPGDPKASLLIKAIEYRHSQYAMPPEDAGGKLPNAQIRDLTKWIRMGAPDPRDEDEASRTPPYVNADAKSWWAFQPMQSYPVPQPSTSWAWNDIDRFIAQKQAEAGIQPLGDATPEVLLRRLYFDLIGLPPPPERQRAFLDALKKSSSRQQVIADVVDELLASEQFGAHWGRHWLDVARYAESSGRDNNMPYNNAWRYRDFVIDAFNRDMPFDMFLIKQIAGDLIDYPDERSHADNMIATGFLAVGSRQLNERSAKQFAVDQADEQIDAVFQATMAFTLACARCHDHKFDPVSQAEYTAVAGIFLSSETHFGVNTGPKSRNGASAYDLPAASQFPIALEPMKPEEYRKAKAELDSLREKVEEIAREQIADKKERKKGQDTSKEVAKQQKLRKLATEATLLETKLEAYHEDGTPKVQALVVVDKPTIDESRDERRMRFIKYLGGDRPSAFPKVDDSPLLARGDIEMPGKKIPRGVPQLFSNQSKYSIPAGKSGRLELANWIACNDNPMTARVAVNRVWHWMMGQGIVLSVDNFGTTGSTPSHPELLDHLALKFQKDQWSIKKLIREIATSRTYQLSSIANATSKDNEAKDPENRLCWRAKSRRLQAEEIRDSMLAATGKLDPKPQIGTTLAKLNLQQVDRIPGRKRNKGEVLTDDICRSVYLSLPRSAAPEMLELFDLPDANAVQGVREATNVPSQSLYLLNNQSVATQSGQVVKEAFKAFPGKPGDRVDERLEFLFTRILCRKPHADEERMARKLLIQSGGVEAGWVSIVRGLFATAEFRYLD